MRSFWLLFDFQRESIAATVAHCASTQLRGITLGMRRLSGFESCYETQVSISQYIYRSK